MTKTSLKMIALAGLLFVAGQVSASEEQSSKNQNATQASRASESRSYTADAAEPCKTGSSCSTMRNMEDQDEETTADAANTTPNAQKNKPQTTQAQQTPSCGCSTPGQPNNTQAQSNQPQQPNTKQTAEAKEPNAFGSQTNTANKQPANPQQQNNNKTPAQPASNTKSK